MRGAIARWLLRMALRLDPYDPFAGMLFVDVDRGMRGRWLLIATFGDGEQARAAQSYLLGRRYAGIGLNGGGASIGR
ncbi:hypothetical protein [Roseateles sp.]|uniref:hypothetical protein n=1 Tax=Roseateles sp. TaxID=1971397 RepID=UPI003BAAFB8B